MLTVLMATHNGAETLPRVLEAYARLEPPPGGWKLVVVDNDSDDRSAEIVTGFSDRLPVVLLHEPRRGKNRALNRALGELEGDLAVFSDDDTLPAPDWLVQLRAAADDRPEYDIFGGRTLPAWDEPPPDWLRRSRLVGALYSVSDEETADGPCQPVEVWGPNMAIRARWFDAGYRFDERIGPDSSRTYAMGGETEFTLRLAVSEQLQCWRCAGAVVHHIVRARQLSRRWILGRAFRLGRCVRREARQNQRAGLRYVPRGFGAIGRGLTRSARGFLAARRAADTERAFDARWQLNFWLGCLYEAVRGRYRPPVPMPDREGAR